ncbi:MAG: glutamine amidotransferase [Myxococcaceae bacterium]
MRPRICVVQTGDAIAPLQRTLGNYDRLFVRQFACLGVSTTVVRAHLGSRLATPQADAVLVTGSRLSVVSPAPWMEQLGEDLREASARGTPILGVCFGHQLLGHAWGGSVQRSPKGREIGTSWVRQSAKGLADPLFRGLPETFAAQTTHEDEVLSPPQGTQILASNAHSQVQALAFNSHVRGVQFHPEFDAAVLRCLITARAKELSQQGRLRSALAGLSATPFAHRVLANFIAHFVSK